MPFNKFDLIGGVMLIAGVVLVLGLITGFVLWCIYG